MSTFLRKADLVATHIDDGNLERAKEEIIIQLAKEL